MFIIGNNAIGKGGFVPAANKGYLLTATGVPPITLTKPLKKEPESIIVTGASGGVGDVASVAEGFTRLQYIRSDGNAYIDTGITASANMGIKVRYSYAASGSAAIAGIYSNTSPERTDTFFISSSNGQTSSVVFMAHGGDTRPTQQTIALNTVYETAINYKNDGKIMLDGAEVGSVGTNIITDQNILLFARLNASNDDITASSSRIYDTEFTDGDTVTHRFVPAKRNIDNALGLYDTVAGEFKTNAGTGSFVAGDLVYAIPITVVSGNLAKASNAIINGGIDLNGVHIEYGTGDFYSVSGKVTGSALSRAVSSIFRVKPSTRYTYRIITEGDATGLSIFVYDGTNAERILQPNSAKIRSFSTSNNTASCLIGVYGSVNTSISAKLKVQVVEGEYSESTMPTYEPHVSKTYNLYADDALENDDTLTVSPKAHTAVRTSGVTDNDIKTLQDWSQDFKLPKAESLTVTADATVAPSGIEMRYLSRTKEATDETIT